ncbi:group 1 truncated hemoglobin [Neptuniibacter sp.]|uniref:group I truncated hemoglobin n=1 Tax=Neptuniibacter sp. TaxID=1962643 RepID=UPI00260D28EC|nr:group 1 truncated hemoglobin [Neptuniibacter sp.]
MGCFFSKLKGLFGGSGKCKASLYERLGGEAAVDAAVDIFYRKVLVDDRISHYFDDVDMDGQAAKQKAFLTMVFGGPNNYTGEDMREGHKHLKGLNDTHFDAVVENLAATLTELGVGDEDIGEIAGIAESVRDDVLNRPKEGVSEVEEEKEMSLYERIGGEAAVDAAVDIFYRKVLADDRISHYFDDVDMDGQAAKQKAFLTMVFGGPHSYTGMDMREGHKHLKGLNDTHFDAVLENLAATLTELGVPASDIEEIAAIGNSVRDDVLNR